LRDRIFLIGPSWPLWTDGSRIAKSAKDFGNAGYVTQG
jgi:hypothetical protein